MTRRGGTVEGRSGSESLKLHVMELLGFSKRCVLLIFQRQVRVDDR